MGRGVHLLDGNRNHAPVRRAMAAGTLTDLGRHSTGVALARLWTMCMPCRGVSLQYIVYSHNFRIQSRRTPSSHLALARARQVRSQDPARLTPCSLYLIDLVYFSSLLQLYSCSSTVQTTSTRHDTRRAAACAPHQPSHDGNVRSRQCPASGGKMAHYINISRPVLFLARARDATMPRQSPRQATIKGNSR